MIQNPPVIAALTGSIGSGKSLAALYFQDAGAHVVDADLLAREAVAVGTTTLQEIVHSFGDILLPDGALDRKKLGKIVFADPLLRKKLESIVHPEVRRLFLARLHTFQNAPDSPLFLYVVPLLFESTNRHPEIQKIITVSAPDALCVQRIMARDGSTEEFAKQKLASQLSSHEKESRADFVIRNDTTKESLEQRVKQVYATITGKV